MKRSISFLLVFLLIIFAVSGCNQPAANSTNTPEATQNPESPAPIATNNSDGEKLNIVSTIFPGYDFMRAVVGDLANVQMLLPPGSESHSFEPTPQDIIAIQNCDVFLYVGGDSDTWVDGILASMDTSNIKVLSMMEMVETVTEEIKEGMEDDHGHSHDEIDPDHIFDRPLSDWTGEWVTIENALKNGDLDHYVQDKATENETDFNTQKAAYEERWKSDYETLAISDGSVSFLGTPVNYRYIGYRYVESESGASVWYGFEAVDPSSSAPAFLAFSDHGAGEDAGHDHEEDEDHEHEGKENHAQEEGHEDEDHGHEHGEETAHFHMRYGNESFDALLTLSNSPTYFPASASGEEIAETMEGHGHAEEYDEHVWTSPKNAIHITQAITAAISEIDAGNSAVYQKNAEAYVAELTTLDASFQDVVKNAARKTLIVGDRFPFRYFVDDYGLNYYAAFPGCSTQTDASAKTVAFLIDKVIEESIPVVLHIEFSNERMADTICESTGAKKLLLHSCHNVTKTEFESGITYLDLMTKNIETLKEALQ